VPELPEVETVRRVLERSLGGKRIVGAEVVPDEIVLQGTDPRTVQEALLGSKVDRTGRYGKTWWLELSHGAWLYGHLGMSGWVRDLDPDRALPTRLREHGTRPLDDESGRPRFLKLLVEAEDGARVALTDGRRLARLWLGGPDDPKVARLGYDCLDGLPDPEELATLLNRRRAPIKSLLLDQGLFAGVGNWIADEALYQAGLSPHRLGSSLGAEDVAALRACIESIVRLAVDCDADSSRYPADWLFHARWGGKSGQPEIGGEPIVREPVGGRTTAWVPSRQK
jgi:formamidopyrimidine-DNA glycosylase